MKNKKSKLAVTLASSALLAGGVISCSEKPAQSKGPGSGTPVIPAAKLAGLSKAEIKKLLAKIEAAKPTEPHLFAGCYDVMLPPQATEYVCPVCSEKTLYSKEQLRAFKEDLDSCRRFLSYITNREAMTLDESSFCKKCKPAAKQPALNLMLRFDDGTTNFISNVTSQDLHLLHQFMAGQLLLKKGDDFESPIKGYLPRLRQLLGMDKESRMDL